MNAYTEVAAEAGTSDRFTLQDRAEPHGAASLGREMDKERVRSKVPPAPSPTR